MLYQECINIHALLVVCMLVCLSWTGTQYLFLDLCDPLPTGTRTRTRTLAIVRWDTETPDAIGTPATGQSSDS